jgi:hypothetical protein
MIVDFFKFQTVNFCVLPKTGIKTYAINNLFGINIFVALFHLMRYFVGGKMLSYQLVGGV